MSIIEAVWRPDLVETGAAPAAVATNEDIPAAVPVANGTDSNTTAELDTVPENAEPAKAADPGLESETK